MSYTWCKSAVNRCFLSSLATCRTRSSALCTPSRPCVRSVLPSSRFPLVRPLPSIASAAVPSALFGDFTGTMGRSDFPSAFIVGSGLSTARHALPILRSQRPMGSPGSRAKCIRTCVGSLTAQGPSTSRHGDVPSIAFRPSPRRRHPEVTHLVAGHLFRSSIPSLHVPLSTLHLRPYGRRCMTRGQCGWLDLQCIKLSFTTLCRFSRRTEIRCHSCAWPRWVFSGFIAVLNCSLHFWPIARTAADVPGGGGGEL